MRKIFDFKCLACEHVFERLVREGEQPPCPSCNGETRTIRTFPRFYLDGTDPGFPRAWRRWGDTKSQPGGPPERVKQF